MSRATPGIAAIVLAAGRSRRFADGDKLLAEAGGVPLLARVLRALAVPEIAPLLCVVPADTAATLRQGLTAEPAAGGVSWIINHAADAGLSTSIVAGVVALPRPAAGVLIVPGDMPALTPRLIQRLLAAFDASGRAAIVHACLADGSQRNPVIWPARLLPELARLAGDRGAKALITAQSHASEGADVIAVVAESDAELIDIDTSAELAEFNATAAGA